MPFTKLVTLCYSLASDVLLLDCTFLPTPSCARQASRRHLANPWYTRPAEDCSTRISPFSPFVDRMELRSCSSYFLLPLPLPTGERVRVRGFRDFSMFLPYTTHDSSLTRFSPSPLSSPQWGEEILSHSFVKPHQSASEQPCHQGEVQFPCQTLLDCERKERGRLASGLTQGNREGTGGFSWKERYSKTAWLVANKPYSLSHSGPVGTASLVVRPIQLCLEGKIRKGTDCHDPQAVFSRMTMERRYWQGCPFRPPVGHFFGEIG